MRIATWNLAGRWSPQHEALMLAVEADVWLLTEVHHRTSVDGFVSYPSATDMASQRHWAAVLSNREGTDPFGPHSASSAVTIDGTTFCSTVLPWRTSGSQPWGDGDTAQRTARAVHAITESLAGRTVLWGGDWNHALLGPEHAGSAGGRAAIERALHEMQLQAPTAGLTHQTPGHHTIDHVAVPETWTVHKAERVPVHSSGHSLSDHDIYVVDAGPAPS